MENEWTKEEGSFKLRAAPGRIWIHKVGIVQSTHESKTRLGEIALEAPAPQDPNPSNLKHNQSCQSSSKHSPNTFCSCSDNRLGISRESAKSLMRAWQNVKSKKHCGNSVL